jgi:hypothetical protein
MNGGRDTGEDLQQKPVDKARAGFKTLLSNLFNAMPTAFHKLIETTS